MSTQSALDLESKTRKVRIKYKTQIFYAYCPRCDHSRECKHEDDGSFTLVCGCMRDGILRTRYLIDASDVHIRECINIRNVDVPEEDSFVSEWR